MAKGIQIDIKEQTYSMIWKRNILFLTLFMISVPLMFAFSNKAYVIVYNSGDYNYGLQNWSVTSDKDGYTYFGNNQGVILFDGSNWSLVPLPENNVARSVYSTDDGRLYIGTFEEFGYYENIHSLKPVYVSLSDSIEDGLLHNNEIWRINESNGKIYFQSFGAIYVYDGNQIRIIEAPAALVLLMKAEEQLFVHVVGMGLAEIIDEKLVFVPGTESLADDEIKVILHYAQDTLLIGAAKQGLFLYANNKLFPYHSQINELLKSSEINAGLRIGDSFVIGTIGDGIFIFDEEGTVQQKINTSNFLINNTILSLYDDKTDNFWVTLDNGIAYVRMNDPVNYYLSSNYSNQPVYEAAYYNEKLWIGTNQGVFVYDAWPNSEIQTPRFIDGTAGQVWDLEVIDNNLYCGHNDGTFLIKEGGIQNLSNISGGFHFEKTIQNNKEVLIQSTYNEMVVYKKEENWEFSHTIKGFQEPIPTFSLDYRGNIWAAHLQKGVFKIRLNAAMDSVVSSKYFDKQQGLKYNRNVSVCNVDGRIVFLTQHEIFTYDDLNDTIIPFTILNNQLGEFQKAERIIKLGKDRYWAVSKNKILLFKMAQNTIEKLFYYDFARQGAYLNFLSPNISIIDSSHFLIGLNKGFAFLDLTRLDTNQKIQHKLRQIVISDQQQNKKELNVDAIANISNHFNSIEFSFSPTKTMISPVFRYRLSGFDADWSVWNSKSKCAYNRLPAGSYLFEVQMQSIDGKTGEPQSFAFSISPPIYFSKFALIVYSLLLLIAAYLLTRYIQNLIRKHASKLHKVKKEELRKEQLHLEQELMTLQNAKLQEEVDKQNVELATYTHTISKWNELLLQLKKEIIFQKEEMGSRYPEYFVQKLMKIIKQMENKDDAWYAFEIHFNRVNKQFVQRLKDTYPQLTTSDLRLCVLLRLNQSTKEIASLLNIGIRGAEVRRYRLRKRLKLSTDENLIDFIMSF